MCLISTFTLVHQVAVFPRLSVQWINSTGSIFFSTCHKCSSTLLDIKHFPSTSYQIFGLALPEIVAFCQDISKYPDLISFVLPTTSCLTTLIIYSSIITDINNTGLTICLFHVGKINSLVPCILPSDASSCLFH